MCKLCDDDAKYGHESESAQSRAGEAGANLTDVLERTVKCRACERTHKTEILSGIIVCDDAFCGATCDYVGAL